MRRRSTRLAGASALLIVATLVAVAPAGASTAYVVPPAGDEPSAVVYAAAAGETNQLTVSGAGDQAVFEDPGATIAPGAGCVADGPNRVVCTYDVSSTTRGVDVTLGDGDDTANLVIATVGVVDGGEGADVLTSGPDVQRLSGGPGDDRLNGGPAGDDLDGGIGRDHLDGGDGEQDCRFKRNECDVMSGGDAAGFLEPDVFVGSGRDMVDYDGRSEPIIADLAAGFGGAEGEGDVISGGLRAVAGGRADDVLSGTDGADFIDGRQGADSLAGAGGRDEIHGRGGGDTIEGGSGGDRLYGGAGNDVFGDDRDRGFDRHSCGTGVDVVAAQDLTDVVDGGACEYAGWFPSRNGVQNTITVSPPWPGSSSSLLRYQATCRHSFCRGTVRIFSRGASQPGGPEPAGRPKLVGRGRFALRRGGGEMLVRLNALGRRLRNRGALFRVRITAEDGTRTGFAAYLRGPTD